MFTSVVPYIEPVYAYSAIIPFYFFGVSVFTARVVAVFYGVATVFAAFLLARRMFGETRGLLTALFLAISPWHFFFSRTAYRWITLPFFFILGIYFLYRGFEEHRRYVIYSAVLFGLTLYTYSTARLFVPLFIALALLVYRKQALGMKRTLAAATIVGLVVSVPLLYAFFKNPDTLTKRFNETSIFNPDAHALEEMDAYLRDWPLPSFISDSKAFRYTLKFAKNYVAYLSPSFLFINGSPNLRHSVEVFGELYWFELPLLIAGLWMLLRVREQKHLLVLAWLLAFPVAASFTNWHMPHAGRAISAIPVFEMLAACGLVLLSGVKLKASWMKAVAALALALLAAYNIGSYFEYYFTQFPKQTPPPGSVESVCYTNVGEALAYVNSISSSYDRIVLTYRCCCFPNYYLAFFTSQNVSLIQQNPTGEGNAIGRFVYNVDPKIYCYKNLSDSTRTLYVIKDDDLQAGDFTLLRTFYNPDGSVSFKVGLCKPPP